MFKFLLPVLIVWFAVLVPLPAWAVSSATEQDILDVIARHPQAIVDSLTAYQQQRQQQETEAHTQALDRVRQNLTQFVADSPVQGDATASVTLVEFADFQCPYCVQAHEPIRSLLQRYPNVAFVFKHLPLVEIHDRAMGAATAAWAANQQGKFWQFYDALYESASLSDDRFVEIAQQLDLNLNQFELDRSSAAARQSIQADVAQASDLGVTGTPFFLVVGQSNVTPIVGANIGAIEAQIGSGEI